MTEFAHSLAVEIGIDAYNSDIPLLTTTLNDAALSAMIAPEDQP